MLNIRGAQDPRVDPAENKLEVRSGVALVGDLGEVDVEPDVLGQVRGSGGDDLAGDGGGQLGVHLAAVGGGHSVPGNSVLGRARECDGRDASVGSVASSANGAGEVNGGEEVGSNVGAGNSKLRRGAVPQGRTDLGPTVPHRGGREGIDPVQLWLGRVAASCAAVSRAAVILTSTAARLGVDI